MPFLPLDQPEPFAATLGVMLYPGTDNCDFDQARAFATQWLAVPLRRFHKDGHRLSYDRLARLIEDGGQFSLDNENRLWGGQIMGDVFKALYCLAKDHPSLASWEHAIQVYLLAAARAEQKNSRSVVWQEIRRFRTVAHLWAAWSIRNYHMFEGSPERDYDGFDDFQSFLAESEILRDFGQIWHQQREKSKPPLPANVWRVPLDWKPPRREPRWPNTGLIPDIGLSADFIAYLKPSGRPHKVG